MKRVIQLMLVAGISGMFFSVRAQTTYQPTTTTTNSEYAQPVQPAPAPAPEEAQVTPNTNYVENENEQEKELFHANEFSADIFAVGTLNEYYLSHTGQFTRKDLRWGGGAGINYFFTKCLGIGGDFDVTSTASPIVDTTTGNLIFRIPFEKLHLAPYIFGGAGYQFQRINQFVGGGGIGIEFRLCDHVGIFADGRYLAARRTNGYGMGRLGLRISF